MGRIQWRLSESTCLVPNLPTEWLSELCVYLITREPVLTWEALRIYSGLHFITYNHYIYIGILLRK